ncbi:bile acid:sodium symporter family protein [Intestinibacter sp.]|uniref:bile acid:sodium symporter family protein n=1 Tax=Intestinibacter sp. TaxID=1965304 RepID=UPI003F154B3B
MKNIAKISDVASKNIGIIIIVLSIVAFFFPPMFSWATSYTSLLLGVAMFGMGLTIKLDDFRIVFTRPKELLIGCFAQFTIMPLLAFCLAKAFHLSPDLAIGVILVGCCPGGTASNVITYIADGDTALSVGMTIFSTLLAPFLTPVLVYLLGGSWVEVSLLAMIISVVKVVLLPVLAGILIYQLFPAFVEKIRDVLPLVSVVAIVLLISGIVGSNADKIVTCGVMVFIVVMLHNICGLLLGLTFSKIFNLNYKKATAVAIEVGMQNSGLAISLATTNFAANPLATLPGAIFSVWHNISGSIFASIRRKNKKDIPECEKDSSERIYN